MKKKNLLTIILFLTLQILYGQDNEETNLVFWESTDFKITLTVAFVSAVFSFLTAYFIFLRQKKNQRKKRLSYDLNVKHGLLEIGEVIKEFIKITYKGQATEKLSFVDFTIQNTGNTVVKNQEIRFSLESKSVFIDKFFDPVPEEELGVAEIQSNNHLDRKIKIEHLEKDQKVSIKFIVSGEDAKIKIIPFNEGGDVEFNPRSLSKIQDETETLNRFLIIIFLIVVSYLVLSGIETEFFNLIFPISIPSIVLIFILIVGFKDIFNGLRIIANRILKPTAEVIAKNAILHSHFDIGSDMYME